MQQEFTVHFSPHPEKARSDMEKLLAVTAIGADRTGLVRDVSNAISSAGGSILQSRMTTLGQEFAMMVLVSANWHAIKKVEDSLAELQERADLTLTVRATEERQTPAPAAPYSVDIVAIDQEGIVAGLATFFATREIEIADLNTRQYNAPHTGAAMFSIQMAISIPTTIHLATLREEFHEFCEEQNLDAIIEPIQR
ncbi:MAG: glycine cleavage system protein R [Gammaproteobacteria bacterium]|nr:MAG: glycine cleavage system protein R [Gammaproteobacteria bacterium]